METKARLVNTIFLPTLTYQCQTWTLTKAQEKRITTCEMRCLRRAAGKTRRDMIRNEEIREMVGATPVHTHIQRQRTKWFGHLVRMAPDQPAFRAYNLKSSDVRPRGRPRRRWIEGVADICKSHGLTVTEASHQALDRRLHLPTTP